VFSPAVDNLVAQLTRLPGVGTRTAQRLAFHLLRTNKDEALALAQAIADVKEKVRFCRECGNLTEDEVCGICLDARRDRTVVCVVEQPADLLSIERTASTPVRYASTSSSSAWNGTGSRRSCSLRTRR
jgi:recombination protein RecR